MKKIVIGLICFFIINYFYGQNFEIEGKYPGQVDSLIRFFNFEKNKLIIDYENPPLDKENLILDYTIEGINGIQFIKLSQKMPNEVVGWNEFFENKNIQTDDRILFLAGKAGSEIIMFAFTKGYSFEWSLTFTGFNNLGSTFYDCSSYLVEKNKEYPIENLLLLSPDTPWVEGIPGYGIGEGFSIGRDKHKYLLLMNGYISYDKPYLYKLNARIKKLKVIGLKSGKEKILDVLDTPHPQTIDISFLTENEDVRVTIEDVFPGTKYEDTCLHYMIVWDEEVIPYMNSVE